MNPSTPDAIFSLLREREKRGETWATLDPETLRIFHGIFEEVGGRGKSILEIGSGHGFTCVLFGLLGASGVPGLEVVPEAVKVAEEVKQAVAPAAPVFFRQKDAAEGLPYPDDTFDILLLVEVVSHVVTDDLLGFFREMVRVLKPGGLLYLQDGNNARSWFLRLKNYEIWERFEKGPATKAGETVHSHRFGMPYVEARRQIAIAAAPSLSSEAAQSIAEGTFRSISRLRTLPPATSRRVSYRARGFAQMSRTARGPLGTSKDPACPEMRGARLAHAPPITGQRPMGRGPAADHADFQRVHHDRPQDGDVGLVSVAPSNPGLRGSRWVAWDILSSYNKKGVQDRNCGDLLARAGR